MSSKLLSDFEKYYQGPELQRQSFHAPSTGENTGSVFDDLACLGNDAAHPSNESSADLSNRPLQWPQKKVEMEIFQPWDFDQAKHAVPSTAQEVSTTLGSRFHDTEAKLRRVPEVLFDAVEELGKTDDEDEFGDFESGVIIPQPEVSIIPSKSLVNEGLDHHQVRQEFQGPKEESGTFSRVEPIDLLELQDRDPPKEALLSTMTMREDLDPGATTTTVTAWPSHLSRDTQSGFTRSVDEGLPADGWGDFEDAAEKFSETGGLTGHSMNELLIPSKSSSCVPSSLASIAAPPNTSKPPAMDNLAHSSTQTLTISKARTPLATGGGLPASDVNLTRTSAAPSNIPPPSILLPFLTTIIQQYYNILRGLQHHATPNVSDSEPICKILQLATTAAHIIAGRKSRWKRDMLLAQNMRIGPSHSGKAGGMKLTGIDRAEALREDREVVDLVRIWKNHLGCIRSAVGATSSISSSIPNLTEMMPVKTSRGSLASTKGCALCGLKREERVDRVDELVEDSFGEWWVEHWGHTTCMWFWDCHHDGLQQR